MNSQDELLRRLASLTVAIADALAPLVEKTEPHHGQWGGITPRPTPTEIATALRSDADALRSLFGLTPHTPGGAK